MIPTTELYAAQVAQAEATIRASMRPSTKWVDCANSSALRLRPTAARVSVMPCPPSVVAGIVGGEIPADYVTFLVAVVPTKKSKSAEMLAITVHESDTIYGIFTTVYDRAGKMIDTGHYRDDETAKFEGAVLGKDGKYYGPNSAVAKGAVA